MFTEDFRFINEEFYTLEILPQQLDALLAEGWRHFGAHFYRYNLGFYEDEIRFVLPLRIRIADFSFSKSQRRVLRKNEDLKTVFRPVSITPEIETLFARHKQRFKTSVPDSIYDFLDTENPAHVPCEALECAVYQEEKLVAVSFFDVGETALSGIYAMFAPEITDRSLGIYTMLREIEFARETGRRFYYPGYAYEGASFYDYKKRFRALEKFNWSGFWEDFAGNEI